MIELIPTMVYLLVSVVALTMHTLSLGRILLWIPTSTEPDRSMHWQTVRTISSRVAASTAYVIVGSIQLLGQSALSVWALALFTAIQCLWLFNSWQDVRYRRRMHELVNHA